MIVLLPVSVEEAKQIVEVCEKEGLDDIAERIDKCVKEQEFIKEWRDTIDGRK